MNEETKNPILRRRSIKERALALMVLSVFLLNCISNTSLLLAFPVSSSPAVDLNISSPLVVPEDLGHLQVQEKREDEKPFVIVIQDAHAILDAQNNIRELIQYFQKQYGVRLIALEGGAGKLDPLLWRTFPDQEIKSEILENYLKRGELTGAQMAAILNSEKADYFGIENWELYGKNYLAYLSAQKVKDQTLQQVAELKTSLDRERQKVYSEKLNRFHEQSEKLKVEQSSLIEFLKYAQSEIIPADSRAEFEQKYPQLSVLMASLDKESSPAPLNLDAAIRQMAEQFKKRFVHKLSKLEAMTFHGKYQEYVSGQGDVAAFLKYLVSAAQSVGLKPQLTSEMKTLLGNHEALMAIRGTRLFDELQQFTTETEDQLAVRSEEKQLTQKYKQLDWLRDLVSLELTRDQFNAYQENPEFYFSGLSKTGFEPALAFYEHALARDEALFENLNRLLEKEKAKSVIVLAGGFHSQGFEKALKEKGFSYAVVTPKIASLEGQEVYSQVMQGKLSYKQYLKTSFYDAFARHSSIQMLNATDQNQAGPILKTWRDEIIRSLAEQGKVEKSSDYTRYLDALFKTQYEKALSAGKISFSDKIQEAIQKELENFKDQISAKLSNQFQSQPAGSLQVSSLSPELALNAGPLSPALRSALVTGDIEKAVPESRSEVRSETELVAGVELPSWLRAELNSEKKEIIGSGSYSVVYESGNPDEVVKVPFNSAEMARYERVSVSAKRPSFQEQLLTMTHLTLLKTQGLKTRYMGRLEGLFHSRKSLQKSRQTGQLKPPVTDVRDVFLQRKIDEENGEGILDEYIDKYIDEQPNLERKLIKGLAARQKSLWKTGYFDADLRRPNYAVVASSKPNHVRIVALDFDLFFYLPERKSEIKNFLTSAPEGFLSPGEHFLMNLFYHPGSIDPLLQKEIFGSVQNLPNVSARIGEMFEEAQQEANQVEDANYRAVFIQTLRNHPSRAVMDHLLSALAENIAQARSELRQETEEINFAEAPKRSLSQVAEGFVEGNQVINNLTDENIRTQEVRDDVEKILDQDETVFIPHIARHLTNDGTALQLIYERVIRTIMREGRSKVELADVAIPITLLKLIAKSSGGEVSGDEVADYFKKLVLDGLRIGAAHEQQINVYASGSHLILVDINPLALKTNLEGVWNSVVDTLLDKYPSLLGDHLEGEEKEKYLGLVSRLRREHYASHAAIQIPEGAKITKSKKNFEDPNYKKIEKRYRRNKGLEEDEIKDLAMDEYRSARREVWLNRAGVLMNQFQQWSNDLADYALAETKDNEQFGLLDQKRNEIGQELSEVLQWVAMDAVEKITERVEAIDKMAKTDEDLLKNIKRYYKEGIGSFLDDELIRKIKTKLTPRTVGTQILRPDSEAEQLKKLKILARAAGLFREGRKSVIPPGQYPNGRIVRIAHMVDEIASEESPRSIHGVKQSWQDLQAGKITLDKFKEIFRAYQKKRDELFVRSYRDNRMSGIYRGKNKEGNWETQYKKEYFYKYYYRNELAQAMLDGSLTKLKNYLSETGLTDLADSISPHLMPMKREIGDELYWIVDALNQTGEQQHFAAFAEYDFLKSYMSKYSTDDSMDGKIHGSLERILSDPLADKIRQGEATFEEVKAFFGNMTQRIREIMPEEFQPKAKPNEELSAEGVLQRMPIFRDRETGIRYAQGPEFWYELDAMTWNIAKDEKGKNKQLKNLDELQLIPEQVQTSITATLNEEPFQDVENFNGRIREVELVNVKQKATRGYPDDDERKKFGRVATPSEVQQAQRSELRQKKIGTISDEFKYLTVLRVGPMSLVLIGKRQDKRYYIKINWPNLFELPPGIGNYVRNREIAFSSFMQQDQNLKDISAPYLIGKLSLSQDGELISNALNKLRPAERLEYFGSENVSLESMGLMKGVDYEYIASEEAAEGYGISADEYLENFSRQEHLTKEKIVDLLNVLADLIKVVQFMNKAGVIHRDLRKTEMIIPVYPGRRPVILDFGLSVRKGDPKFTRDTLGNLQQAGKALYASNLVWMEFFKQSDDIFRDVAAIYDLMGDFADALPVGHPLREELQERADQGLGFEEDSKLLGARSKIVNSTAEDQTQYAFSLYDEIITWLEKKKWEFEKQLVPLPHLRALNRAVAFNLIKREDLFTQFLSEIPFYQDPRNWLITAGKVSEESVKQAIRVGDKLSQNPNLFGFDIKRDLVTKEDRSDVVIQTIQQVINKTNEGAPATINDQSELNLVSAYFFHLLKAMEVSRTISDIESHKKVGDLVSITVTKKSMGEFGKIDYGFTKKYEGTPLHNRTYQILIHPYFKVMSGGQVKVLGKGILGKKEISSQNLIGYFIAENTLVVWDHQIDYYFQIKIAGKKADIQVLGQDAILESSRSELRVQQEQLAPQEPLAPYEDKDKERLKALLQHVIGNQIGSISSALRAGAYEIELAKLGNGEIQEVDNEFVQIAIENAKDEKAGGLKALKEFVSSFDSDSSTRFFRVESRDFSVMATENAPGYEHYYREWKKGKRDLVFVNRQELAQHTGFQDIRDTLSAEIADLESMVNLLDERLRANPHDQTVVLTVTRAISRIENELKEFILNGDAQEKPKGSEPQQDNVQELYERSVFLTLLHHLNHYWWLIEGDFSPRDETEVYTYLDKTAFGFRDDAPDADGIFNATKEEFNEMKNILTDIISDRIELGKLGDIYSRNPEHIIVLQRLISILDLNINSEVFSPYLAKGQLVTSRSELREIQNKINSLDEKAISKEITEKVKRGEDFEPVLERHLELLINQGVVSEADVKGLTKRIYGILIGAFSSVDEKVAYDAISLDSVFIEQINQKLNNITTKDPLPSLVVHLPGGFEVRKSIQEALIDSKADYEYLTFLYQGNNGPERSWGQAGLLFTHQSYEDVEDLAAKVEKIHSGKINVQNREVTPGFTFDQNLLAGKNLNLGLDAIITQIDKLPESKRDLRRLLVRLSIKVLRLLKAEEIKNYPDAKSFVHARLEQAGLGFLADAFQFDGNSPVANIVNLLSALKAAQEAVKQAA